MKEWNFPTGECGVIADNDNLSVHWDWMSENDIFRICSKLNAISIKYPYETITLNAPYFPYSRQDKMFNIGESSSLELLIKLLAASCKNLKINTTAIHNLKAFKYYCELNNISSNSVKWGVTEIIKAAFEEEVNIVFPDKHAQDHFAITPMPRNIYYCSKVRGDKGEITSFECEKIKNPGLPTYILDDICDGGATFIKCATALKEQGIEDIRLFIYHGFFTKGLDGLFSSGIKQIYTTDSVCRIQHDNVHILAKGDSVCFK